MSMLDELARAIKSGQAILFAGAGVSQNLGLPSWGELIGEIAQQLDYDDSVFSQHGDYLALAEYYQIQKTSLGSLRSWMDRKWHTDEHKVDRSEIHQKLIELNFPIIYTTNYDRWFEIAYERRGIPFLKVVSVGDISHIQEGTTQIVKLHGDFDNDDSLVLTETSYFERLNFESPLDIKFRSDSLGKTIFFIGYSISDVNIRYLLYKLYRLWEDSGHAGARPKSYIFLTRPNPVQEAILRKRGIIPLVSDSDDPAQGLQTLLDDLLKAVAAL